MNRNCTGRVFPQQPTSANLPKTVFISVDQRAAETMECWSDGVSEGVAIKSCLLASDLSFESFSCYSKCHVYALAWQVGPDVFPERTRDLSPLPRRGIWIGANVKGRRMEIVWGWLSGPPGETAALFHV